MSRPGDAHRDGGTVAVAVALAANIGIAVAKLLGFVLTRSSSMGSETVHSFADCGNQVLLLFGARRARREPNDKHPFGHGSERFFWGFLVAVVLFVLGAGFAATEGIHKIAHPHPPDRPGVALIILGVAVVLESLSLRTGVMESNKVRGPVSWPAFIRQTKNPDLALVLLEDVAALTGLFVALIGVAASSATGDGVYDGVASVVIAAVLAAIAGILGNEMHSLLVGEAASVADQDAIRAAILSVEEFDRVIHLRTQHLGPDELLVAAKVAAGAGDHLADISRAVDRAEERIRAAVPAAHYVFVEPDVDRDAAP
ncbi:MAG: cation diffusion facilitator family transporter [Acidimicrobiales bacterium]